MNNKIIDYGKRYDRIFWTDKNLSQKVGVGKELTNWQIAGIVFIFLLIMGIAGNGNL